MPVFDYRCKKCNTNYDILHKGKEIIEDIQCPACGSQLHVKLISAPSIVTKGKSISHCSESACGMEKSYCKEMCGMN
jgi:putative FmdB family regulatory protein